MVTFYCKKQMEDFKSICERTANPIWDRGSFFRAIEHAERVDEKQMLIHQHNREHLREQSDLSGVPLTEYTTAKQFLLELLISRRHSVLDLIIDEYVTLGTYTKRIAKLSEKKSKVITDEPTHRKSAFDDDDSQMEEQEKTPKLLRSFPEINYEHRLHELLYTKKQLVDVMQLLIPEQQIDSEVIRDLDQYQQAGNGIKLDYAHLFANKINQNSETLTLMISELGKNLNMIIILVSFNLHSLTTSRRFTAWPYFYSQINQNG
jgi:hypothetical protein